MPTNPTWTRDTIWWHVYPLGFTGAAVRPANDSERALTPRLRHIESWLDYLIELGCNGLALGPIFQSRTHGYDTTDYFTIDPRLGSLSDFDSLVATCHAKGIRIMLDGVFNHVASGHFPELVLADHVFEGHESLQTLDHSRPETAEMVRDVMKFWLDRGIDAWRLDAAYAVPAEFWDSVIPEVQRDFPESWFIGEVIHGEYPAFASHIGSITQYELWKATFSSLNDANFYELDWCLQRHQQLLSNFIPYTFIGNHDVTRIASQVGAPKAALALTLLMTVPGIPAIYYGDEQGFTGVKEEREGGDDAIRPMFPSSPFPPNPMFELHQRLIAFRRRHAWLVDAHVETLHLDNEHYRFRAHSGEAWVEVELWLTGQPRAVISAHDEVEIHVQLT
ncbi:alpha-amylase family glycosyl hydrolase [Corynebacterium epidermidicanis]|uniref:Glycosidase n=1 Tax=Corynebacterium epidermidicanis TaxID=1050174 RepID=A0A0G3GXI6_9CORY|nr:alpha-amylase family glycosyl hydrolase [Corynebacterium epidermidicanis]AKK04228.1 glycosidase [Corynebacterium epidermidicanis]